MDVTDSATNAPPKAGDTERQDQAAQAISLALSRRQRIPTVSVPGLTILRCLGEKEPTVPCGRLARRTPASSWP